jgi:hypothetical protein
MFMICFYSVFFLKEFDMEELLLHHLPDLPQSTTLKDVVMQLQTRSEIVALWIEGSLARGGGDRFSDVDLHIAVEPEDLAGWKAPIFARIFASAPVVGQLFLPFGEHAFLHHLVLANGEIFDFFVQDINQPLSSDAKLVLNCRDPQLAQALQQKQQELPAVDKPVQKEQLQQLLDGFWISTHKHAKVLHRGLTALTLLGLSLERNILLRLWYIEATAQDCGDLGRSTIHSLTHVVYVVEQQTNIHALELLGMPLRSRTEIYRTIESNRRVVAEVGRSLAHTYTFTYPETLETAVEQSWLQFLATE